MILSFGIFFRQKFMPSVLLVLHRPIVYKFYTEVNLQNSVIFWYILLRFCSRVGTFGTESAVKKRGGIRNLPYLNAKPRQIPLLSTYA